MHCFTVSPVWKTKHPRGWGGTRERKCTLILSPFPYACSKIEWGVAYDDKSFVLSVNCGVFVLSSLGRVGLHVGEDPHCSGSHERNDCACWIDGVGTYRLWWGRGRGIDACKQFERNDL